MRLVWVGSPDRSTFVPWAPARDLEEVDLARLVYRRTSGRRLDTSDGLRPADEGFAEALAGVVHDLLSSGLYADDAARHDAPAAPKPAPATPRPMPEPEPAPASTAPEAEASAPPEATGD